MDSIRERKEKRNQHDVTMNSKQNDHVCIRVEFRRQLQYCDIRLDNLSRETFLKDGTNPTHIRFWCKIKTDDFSETFQLLQSCRNSRNLTVSISQYMTNLTR